MAAHSKRLQRLEFLAEKDACQRLVQPLIYRPRGITLGPAASPETETSDDDPGWRGRLNPANYRVNRDAFDTIGLVRRSLAYLSREPICSDCCLPSGRNSADENPETCSCTVQVGSQCWLAGTVNYGTYGIMMRLGYDYFHSPLFSRYVMTQLIRRYIGGRENADIPLSWAVATWNNGPGAMPPGPGNRPRCRTTCRYSATGGFDYVWEPVKPASRINFDTFSPMMVCESP